MTNTTTREKLIDAIVDAYLAAPEKKLKVSDICARADISRQAFYKSHDDLRQYVAGEKPIADLLRLSGKQELQSEMLSEAHDNIKTLHQQLEDVDDEYNKKLQTAISNHITSLMNSDLIVFEATYTQETINKQALQIDNLSKELTELKISSAYRTTPSLKDDENHSSGQVKKSLQLLPNLSKAKDAYKKNTSFEIFQDEKSKAIETVINKVIGLGREIQLHIIIDLYLVSPDDMATLITQSTHKTTVLLYLPIFSELELKLLVLKRLPLSSMPHLHVPALPTSSRRQLQRQIYAKGIPQDEIDDADKVDHFNLGDQLLAVTYHNLGQLFK